MIFDVVINDSEKATKSLKIFGSSFKEIISDFKTNGNISQSLSGLFGYSQKDIAAFKEYNKLVNDGVTDTDKLMGAMSGASVNAQNLAAKSNGAAINIKGLSTAEKVATVEAKVMGVALNTALSFGIGFAIQAIITGIDKLIHAEEEATEKAKEAREQAANVANDFSNELKSLSNLQKEYIELYTTTNQLSDSKEKLLEIQSKLNDGFNSEKDKIDLLNDSLKEEIRLYQKKEYEAAKETQRQNEDAYKSALKPNGVVDYGSAFEINASSFGKDQARQVVTQIDQAFIDYFNANTDYIIQEWTDSVTGEIQSYAHDALSFDKNYNVFSIYGSNQEDALQNLGKMMDMYSKWDNYNSDVYNNLKSIYNEISDQFKNNKEIIETYEQAAKIISDYEDAIGSEKADKLTSVLEEAANKMNELQEAAGTSKYLLIESINELKTEALSLAGDNSILADSVNSVFANYNSGLSSATDSFSSFNAAWFKGLDDFEKEQVSAIDTMVKAIQKIATGERISEKDFFDIFELDTDRILQDISMINGEASMSLESLIKLKDSYIQKQIETYKASNEEIRKEHQDQLTELAMYKLSLEQIQKEIAEKNIDTTKTVYGNVDTDTREILEWSDKNLEKYADAIESWGMSADELQGTVSTVLGSVDEFNGIDIAFTPVLETANGSILLDHDTVYKYISSIMSKLDNEWTSEDLFKLDAEGLEVNGIKIKNILADVGDTAERTSQIMHYLGKNGALAYTEKMFNEAANSAKDITNSLDTNNTMIEYLNSLLGNTIDLTKAIEALQKKADNYQKAFEAKIDGIIDGLNSEKEAIQEDKTALEEQLKVLEKQEDELKKIVSNYEKVADLVNDTIDTEIDSIQEAYDKQIEALKSQNEEREEALDLAKKLADLENAKNNKVVTYTEAGGFQYGVSKEAVESAQKEYDNALNDAEIKRLEEERDSSIKSLEDYAKKWSAISKKSEKEEAEKLAIDILGSDWREKIANQDLDILDEYEAEYDDYGKKLNQISNVEKVNLEKSIKIKDEEIEAKEAQIKEWNNYKTHVKADIEAIKNSQEEYTKYLKDIKLSEASNLEERERAYSEFKDRYTAIVQEIIDVTEKLNGTSATIDVKTNIEQISDEMMEFILNYGDAIKKMGESLEEGRASVNSAFDAKLVEAWKALKKLAGGEGYASGGTASYTGMAMLHGTQQKSEVIFNAAQSRSLYDMVKSGNFANLVASKAMDGFKIAQNRNDVISNRNASIVFTGNTINLPNVQNPEQFAKQMERYIQTTLTESQIIPPRA